MSLPTLQGTGRLIEAPELRFTAHGKAVVRVRLAFNARRKDDRGEWVDGDSFFIDGKAFDKAAENIAESLDKGMEVLVSGRLRTERWETPQGDKRSAPALLIDAIGPSLKSATAKVAKSSGRGGQGGYGGGQGGGQQAGGGGGWGGGSGGAPRGGGGAPADDPWASDGGAGGYGDEPPF